MACEIRTNGISWILTKNFISWDTLDLPVTETPSQTQKTYGPGVLAPLGVLSENTWL